MQQSPWIPSQADSGTPAKSIREPGCALTCRAGVQNGMNRDGGPLAFFFISALTSRKLNPARPSQRTQCQAARQEEEREPVCSHSTADRHVERMHMPDTSGRTRSPIFLPSSARLNTALYRKQQGIAFHKASSIKNRSFNRQFKSIHSIRLELG